MDEPKFTVVYAAGRRVCIPVTDELLKDAEFMATTRAAMLDAIGPARPS